MMLFGIWSCFSLLPLAVFVGLVIILFLWLREKTLRDELVLNLLIEIQQILAEINERVDADTGPRRP